MARLNTQRLIIEAAVRVAADHGISGASMDQIAETAGVAKGSLYYNFSSKDAIFEAVVRDGFLRLASAIDEARASSEPIAAPRAVAAATLEGLCSNLDLAKLLASEMFRVDRPWASTMELARSAVVVRLRDVLRESHEVAGDVTAAEQITEITGAAFFGALAGACLDWQIFRSEQPLGAVLDQVLRAFRI